jgi:hypothetical protein
VYITSHINPPTHLIKDCDPPHEQLPNVGVRPPDELLLDHITSHVNDETHLSVGQLVWLIGHEDH